MTAGAGANVATDAVFCNDNEESAELNLHLGCRGWTLAQYKTDYLTSLDARRFNAMFSDGRNKEMFERRDTRRYTNMGTWERRWNAMKSCCLGYISPIGPFDMPFVRHEHELDYLRNLQQLMARVGDFERMSDIKLICLQRPYDHLYLVYDAPDCWRKLDFEGRHRRGSQHLRFMRCHNLELFALPYRDRDGLYPSIPKSLRTYELQIALGVANPLVWSYLSACLYWGGTELK